MCVWLGVGDGGGVGIVVVGIGRRGLGGKMCESEQSPRDVQVQNSIHRRFFFRSDLPVSVCGTE